MTKFLVARMLKFTAASIAAPVTKLFNQSISTGCFPVTWKQWNVVPIPKFSDKASPANYRPVSEQTSGEA